MARDHVFQAFFTKNGDPALDTDIGSVSVSRIKGTTGTVGSPSISVTDKGCVECAITGMTAVGKHTLQFTASGTVDQNGLPDSWDYEDWMDTIGDIHTDVGDVHTDVGAIDTKIGTPADTDVSTDIANIATSPDSVVMLGEEQIGKSLRFVQCFTENKLGKTGLTVTVDVYAPSGSKIITGAAAHEVGDGYYDYLLAASYVVAGGQYLAIFTTATTSVDMRDRFAAWMVGQSWIERVTATLAASESSEIIRMEDTLAGLTTLFRTMANDLQIGNFTTAEAKRLIMLAKLDTEVAAKCHRDTIEVKTTAGRIRTVDVAPTAGGSGYSLHDILTVSTGGAGGKVEVVAVSSGEVTAVRLYAAGSGYTVGAGKSTTGGTGTGCLVRILALEPNLTAETHTYDASPIFEPTEVSLGETLTRCGLEQTGVSIEAWNNTPSGIPEKWMLTSGGQFRVWPTLSAAALTQIGTINPVPTAGGSGYASGDELVVGGSGSGAVLVVTSVDGSGAVTGLEIKARDEGASYRGSGYAVASGIATTGGGGSGCTVEITELAPLRIHGFAVKPDDLLAYDDIPLTIPKGYRVSGILNRSLELACSARSSSANNLAKRQGFHDEWGTLCATMRGR